MEVLEISLTLKRSTFCQTGYSFLVLCIMIEVKKGERFGGWVTIKEVEKKKGKRRFLCKCDCGVEREVILGSLRSGISKSCGCLRGTHGMRETREYRTWIDLKQRCTNKNNERYKNYGGRGISICYEWIKFENFYKDMGERPQKKSLDRIDNNKGYSKGNCRWATSKEQANNTRNNRMITYNGLTLTLAQWSDKLDIKYHILWDRLRRGWSTKKTLQSEGRVYKFNKL